MHVFFFLTTWNSALFQATAVIHSYGFHTGRQKWCAHFSPRSVTLSHESLYCYFGAYKGRPPLG